MEHVSFTRMEDGTAEEYEFLARLEGEHKQASLADNLLALVKSLAGPTLGYRIDRYEHSLQSATRAMRDGAPEDMIVAALLHDVGDVYAPDNHSAFAAAIVRPYVSAETHWVIKHHGLFQGYYFYHHLGGDRDGREQFRGHPHFEACANFCEKWDQNCFDPDYDTAPLSTFEPMLRRVFARAPSIND